MLPPLATTSHSRVVLFYKYFVPEECPRLLSQHSEFYVDKLLEFQKDICTRLGLKGRILLSSEGINGTVSGRDRGTIQEYISTMDSFDLQDCGLPGGIDEVDDDEGESCDDISQEDGGLSYDMPEVDPVAVLVQLEVVVAWVVATASVTWML